MENLLADNK